ncbi:hypothetical protein EDB92DRAFT_2095699 [Lactarius akahatsu]|uniref:F-box domain-containing protein n=1 Tax=Lactarius akahatsu TaxID=416441 RepID=A0AAD4Q7J4_9AGAM|nr:hypothetical protein EDB92DRAFT_2095699 [Lactarius akahatsu]
MAGLTSLPPELFACILDCVPSIDLQQTTISLLRILSYGRIPNWRRYLFYHIHLKSSDNVLTLGEHLQRTPGDANFIKKFSLATRTANADVAINVILMIPELEWLSLYTHKTFTIDHLTRLFHKPMPTLRYLSLRLRPYEHTCIFPLLQPAFMLPFIFTQFLYYDSLLDTLADWPSAELPTISVVEDLVNDSTRWSAYPFTAFHLNTLSYFASSPFLARTHALRLRFPTREMVRILRPSRWRSVLPCITFLDLSSSCLSDSDVSKLLHSLPRLRHLVLDQCDLFDDAHTRDWATFARHCMFAGKDLNLERVVNRRLVAVDGASGPGGSHPREVRILPRVSALRTLSLSVPAHIDVDARRVLLAEFRRGWEEAVAMFSGIVSAARRSRTEEGVLTYRFPWPGEVGNALREYSSLGVVVVDDNDEFSRLSGVGNAEDCPVVCLAGQMGREEGIEHAEGCSHSVGWDIWEDTL